jgi:hypothetical protein
MTRRLLHRLVVPLLRRALDALDRVPTRWANVTDDGGER